LVCLDYAAIMVTVPNLSLEYVAYYLMAFVFGVGMVMGAYMYRRIKARRWLYVVMVTSLLGLFLGIGILSELGAFLGSISSIYLLTKTRVQPPVQRD